MDPTKSMPRAVMRTLVLTAAIASVMLAARQYTHAQGYIAEMQGVWKTDRRVIVKKGNRVAAGTRLNSVSRDLGDMIAIIDPNSDVVAGGNCLDGCQIVTVPNTQSWSGFFYCLLVRCGSIKYSTSGTKGGECTGVDGIVGIDINGVTDLATVVEFGERSRIKLRFQRRINGRIDEIAYDLTQQGTTVKKLGPGLYDVIEDERLSRLLVLPSAAYASEKAGFSSFMQKIGYWKEHRIGNCTIKSFTQAYVEHVAKKYKKQLRQAGRTTGQ